MDVTPRNWLKSRHLKGERLTGRGTENGRSA